MAISLSSPHFPRNAEHVDYKDDANKHFPYTAASLLTEPVCKAHEFARRTQIIDIIHPTDAKIINFARKCILALGAVFLAALALFASLPGIAIRAAAAHIEKNPFIYRRGNGPETSLSNNQFTLHSQNICCVPGGYAITNGGVMPWRFRINAIVDQIKETNADVVSLYEIFDSEAGKVLYSKLKDQYAHFYINIGAQGIGVSSGFFVASKFKIDNPEFTPFPKEILYGRAKNSNKGVFAFDLQSQNRNFARLFVTHLQHSEASQFPIPSEAAAREKQMKLIAEKVTQVQNKIAILTGDLNMGESELSALPYRSQFTKGQFPESEHSWGGDAFCASLVGDRSSEPLTLDHTLLLNNADAQLTTTYTPTGYNGKTFNKDALSDHKGLYSTITLPRS